MDPVEIQKVLQLQVKDYVTVLIALEGNGDDETFLALGSGVFVEMGGFHGILTAAHVVNDILNAERVGIHLYDTLGSPRIPTSDIIYVKFPEGGAEDEGPDLGIMLLPKDEIERIQPYKKFFSITEHKEFIGRRPPHRDSGLWFIQGFPWQLVEDSPPEGPYKQVFKITGVAGFSTPQKVFVRDDFDYVDLSVDIKVLLNSKDLYDFRGMSGGGLWYTPFDEQTGKIMFNELTLIGTTYYQDISLPLVSPDFDSEISVSGIVRCHGWMSLYTTLFNSVMAALRNPNHPVLIRGDKQRGN